MRKLIALFFLGLVGCQKPGQPVSFPKFNNDIRVIVTRRCMACHEHRWHKYQNIIDKKKEIEYKVLNRQMPPGGLPEPDYTTFKNWIEQGFKK